MEAGFYVWNDNATNVTVYKEQPVAQYSEPLNATRYEVQDGGRYPGPPTIGFEGAITHMSPVVPAETPYGFRDSSWLGEQQSTCPHPPPQAPPDGYADSSLSVPGPGGLWIGLENFHVADCAGLYYHDIDHVTNYCVDLALYTAASADALRRRHTIPHNALSSTFSYPSSVASVRPHSPRIQRQQSFSEYGSYSPPLAPPTRSFPVENLQIQLQAKSQSDSRTASFSKALKSLKSEYSASNEETNPGRVWSVALGFLDDFRDEVSIQITIYSDSAQQPLHFMQKNSITVGDLITKILNDTNCFPASQSPYPLGHNPYTPGQSQYIPEQSQYNPGQNQYNAGQSQYNPGQSQYNAEQNQYNRGQSQYNPGQNQYNLVHNHYNSEQTQYSPVRNMYKPGQNHLSPVQNEYKPGQSQYNPEQGQYNAVQNQYNPVQAKYSPGRIQYNPGQSQYSPAHNQYNPGQAQYNPGQTQYPPVLNQYPPVPNRYSPVLNQYPPVESRTCPSPLTQPLPSLYPLLESLPKNPSPQQTTSPERSASAGSPEEDTSSGWKLSICGRDEYLRNDYSLRSHINLLRQTSAQLRLRQDRSPGLARSAEDAEMELDLSKVLEHEQYWNQSRQRIFAAVQRYGEEVRSVLHNQVSVQNLLESVKEICHFLRSVETSAIRKAITALVAAASQALEDNRPATASATTQTAKSWTFLQSGGFPQSSGSFQNVLLQLSEAIAELINLYSQSFQSDFQAMVPSGARPYAHRAVADGNLSFHIQTVHNLPDSWTASNVYYVSCAVTYTSRTIHHEVNTCHQTATRSLFSAVIFDEVVCLPLALSSLPYESMLLLKLWGVKESPPGRDVLLAWTCLPLHSEQVMVQGNLLLNMISHTEPPAVIAPGAFDATLPTLITIQVDFPEWNHRFNKPEPEVAPTGARVPFKDCARHLDPVIHRNSVLFLSAVEKQALWDVRSSPDKPENILPLLLGSAPSWDPPTISAMYRILMDWDFTDPLEALGLLTPSFSDRQIRETASYLIGKLPDDELLLYLPQLIQAVKFEWDLDSALVRLLLHRALQSIRVAQSLYWLLTDAVNEPHYRGLYQKLLAALQFCVGKAMNEEFSKQKMLVQILQNIAEKVKNVQDAKRKETLQENLHQLEGFFHDVQTCRLPLDPGIVVKGIERSKCSFFKSNACPLKVSFINADPLGETISVIFKIGDDLRQDMLVLQLIEVMDRIWLKEGLDLHMTKYTCLSTGKMQGLVQMVPDSTTLAAIHEKFGLLSPFKAGTIQKWFRSSCTPEKVSENFLYSCAGWCVATFLLGVCDRHNDNIMFTDSGHLFHIDFGKFMGNAQKFGNIKRDRAPFIFTNEMEFFITEGGENSERCQHFVEICCNAYNVLRRHSALLISLLELMLQAGLPELRNLQDLSYLQNNLRPQDSDLEAASFFTKKIQESLESFPVKLNNLIHILANKSKSDPSSLITMASLSPAKALKGGLRKLHEKVCLSVIIRLCLYHEGVTHERPRQMQRMTLYTECY
uniref:Phosphatidylinositol-4-phosphate 3-kinase n=1 Tax=Leptobrachium leishanense TaxID=445787 RepID=A0A8C5MHB4_9ANUR